MHKKYALKGLRGVDTTWGPSSVIWAVLERIAADRIRDSQGCRSVIPFR